ncbi:hypothetical protein BYT27DRAFT_7206348 [Phlegmacium glaucopus]|nr:hypothetical protein BYT27DRAFT_7206348 [Phlegmacium glaucopus]
MTATYYYMTLFEATLQNVPTPNIYTHAPPSSSNLPPTAPTHHNHSPIFLDAFAGTDKPLNLILKNAEEYRISHGPGQGAKLNENGVEVYERKDATDKGRRDRGDNIYL